MTPAPKGAVNPLIAVTGSQAPYIYDLPQLLSLPDGFEFRFRYFPVWVAEELRGKLQSNRGRDLKPQEKVFAGEALLLLFHSQESRRLLPLRLCTVISLEGLGPLVFLRFRLGRVARVSEEVIATRSPEPARSRESRRLNRDAVGWLGLGAHDLSAPLPEGMYLRRAVSSPPPDYWFPTETSDIESEAAAWAAMAALLHGERQLRGIPLFKLIAFMRKDGSYRKPVDIKRTFTVSPESTKGFKLTEGERYRLRVLEWCETIRGGDPGTMVSATVPHELLSLEGSSNLVVGKYDILEFACMARKPGYGELAIRVEAPPRAPDEERNHSHAEDRPWPYIYAARLPIYVTHNWRRLVILLIVGALGILLYVWPPDVSVSPFGLRIPPRVGQLVGLVMTFVALGEYLERFVKFSSDVKELSVSPSPLGAKKVL